MPRRITVVHLFICTLLLVGLAIAQAPVEKVDLDAIGKIKEEGLKRSQVMELASYITDVHGPRLTNSPNYRAACEWAKKKLTEWGLQNVQLEAWGPFGRGWSLEGFSCNMVAPHFSPLIGFPKAWSPSTNGVVRGEVVYFDAKNDAELEKFKGKLKGAIVLMSPPQPVRAHFEPEGRRHTDERLAAMANATPPGTGGGGPGGPPPFGRRRFEMTEEQRAALMMSGKKLQMCHDEGAAVLLEPSRGDGGVLFVQSARLPSAPGEGERLFGGFGGRSPYAKDAPPAIPQIVLSADYYNRLVRTVTKGVPVKLEVSITAKFYDDDLNGYNVIAEIPGTDLKDEIVMIGAHFDSWHGGTGATDNAAGAAVCLEAVRILQALGLKPRRTIRIGLWGGEEQGLLGSRAHVAQHYGSRNVRPAEGQPPLELKPAHEKFSAYFNLDNGTGKIRGIYLQGNEACRPIFTAWLEPFKELGATTVTISNTGGTDHQSFDAVGLPGFQFIQDPIEYDTRTHHTNIDNMDRLIEDDLKQAATVMAAFAYNAAMRDQKLPRKPPSGQPAARGR